MATNSWFDSQFSEEDGNLDSELYRSLIEESIQIKGRDLVYLPRTVENFDSYFLEDRLPSSFNGSAIIEMYLENTQEWQGQQEIYSKFGLEIRDSATMIVSKRRFEQEVTALFPDVVRPREGDVLIMNKRYDKRIRAFEITWVDKESPFYQLGDLPAYKLTIRNFEYSGEKFNTGDEDIDSYTNDYSLITEIAFTSSIDAFLVGETVTNGTGWSAEVIAWNSPVLSVAQVKGELNNLLPVEGEISGATGVIQKINSEVANDSGLNDNDSIDNSGGVNFSESNPFSGF